MKGPMCKDVCHSGVQWPGTRNMGMRVNNFVFIYVNTHVTPKWKLWNKVHLKKSSFCSCFTHPIPPSPRQAFYIHFLFPSIVSFWKDKPQGWYTTDTVLHLDFFFFTEQYIGDLSISRLRDLPCDFLQCHT